MSKVGKDRAANNSEFILPGHMAKVEASKDMIKALKLSTRVQFIRFPTVWFISIDPELVVHKFFYANGGIKPISNLKFVGCACSGFLVSPSVRVILSGNAHSQLNSTRILRDFMT